MKFNFKKFFIASAVLLVVLILTVGFFLFTPAGADFVLTAVIKHFAKPADFKLLEVDGSLVQGIELKDVYLKDIKDLPEGSEIRIQALSVEVDQLGIKGINAQIKNIRLRLPGHEPMVINGTIDKGVLDLNLFAAQADYDLIKPWLPSGSVAKRINGSFKDVDIFARGPLLGPTITGGFYIEELTAFKAFIRDVPVDIDLKLKRGISGARGSGRVKFASGLVQFRKAKIQLSESYVRFDGDFERPTLDIHGISKVGKTTITAAITGNARKPDIQVSSQPPHPREKLLVMLVTGKEWASFSEALEKGEISADLAKDFVDYIFFSGGGESFLDKIGISDFSVKFNKSEKGISGKTTIIPRTEVGIGVEEVTDQITNERQIKQSLEGDLSVTDTVSVGVSKEIQRPAAQSETTDTLGTTEEKVLLKYKKKF